MPKVLKYLILVTLAALLVAGAAGGVWLRTQWLALGKPAGAPEAIVTVDKGTTFGEVVGRLREAGFSPNRRALRLYTRYHPEILRVKAGDYAVGPSDSTLAVLGRIRRGEVIQRSVTIPEGWNLKAIAEAVEAAELAPAPEFLRLATDTTFLSELQIPAASLEGYLFPDTYRFARHVGAASVIQAMIARFRRSLPADYEERARAVGLSAHQAVILASIIEKETAATQERRLISAVFHNRLKKHMRLQSDPTVIYGIVGYDGNIHKRNLLEVTPYNTYRINGLPAGPIASPGQDALLAAVEPAAVNYLYFVSRNDGTHVFSANLKQHNLAVDKFQKSLLHRVSR